jgi:SAM-dependent methyltransferase
MATAPDLREFALTYVGMDIDRASVNWCQRNITPLNSAFTFYHADIRNTSYNPHAPMNADAYRFPHPDSSFDLILLSSVFTHMLENELRHYFQEIARLLAPGGVAHASFFLYQSAEELSAGIPRHGIRFLVQGRGHYAVNRQDHPANAVAYHEEFVRGVAQQAGLSIIDPTLYGGQDVLLFVKRMNLSLKETLGEGWYEEEEDENGHWRWTKRTFVVHVKQPRSGASQLWFRFRLPEALIQEIGRVCLKAVIAGVPLREREYSTPGEHIYVERLLETPREDIVTVRFELDKCYGPKPNDLRELGVQVAFHSLCGVTLRELSAIHLTP